MGYMTQGGILRRWALSLSAAAAASCAAAPARPVRPPARLEPRSIKLPAPRGGVVDMDYLGTDRPGGRVWVPAGNTGRVDVIEAGTGALSSIEGFPVVEVEVLGTKEKAGPTAVAVGEGVVYIGNRGDGTICAIDARTLERGPCLKFSPPGLEATPDGLAYVAATKELWVTIGAPAIGVRPPDRSLAVLDASAPRALAPRARIVLEGAAEGYAVDDDRGIFYTNLEDADRTLAIDVRKKKVVATWTPGCGPRGPRGLAVDRVRSFLFVACLDKVVALDADRDGALLGSIETGEGVDNIDYLESRQELYVAAAKAATLHVIRVDDRGRLTRVATGATAPGARVVVADAAGRAYVADSAGGRILVFEPAP